jgi:uncharacterized protein (TIGR02646 family)
VKRIVKAAEPASLRDWRLGNRSTPENLRYGNIPSDVLAAVRTALLREQGFLCGYTMLRLKDESKGHIEHVQAQSLAREAEVDYANLIYCHPGGKAPHCPFGAHAKGDADSAKSQFVSPLDTHCESRFVYRRTGEISPRDPNDAAATQTIERILNLNHFDLLSQRKAAIDSLAIFRRSARQLTSAEATKMAEATQRTDSQGRYQPFAPVLRQFLLKYASQRAARDKALQGRDLSALKPKSH